MRTVTAGLLALALSGCASAPWERPDVSAAQRTADLDECRQQARLALRRDQAIDTDILASRSNDWQRSNVIERRQDSIRTSQSSLQDDVVGSCMSAKGYRRARPS